MSQHTDALDYAISQLGVHEDPWGSNRGPRVNFYEDYDFLAGHGYPWCISFIQACWAVGGKRPLPYKTAGAYDLFRWALNVGWARPIRECTPGDPVVFNIGEGHGSILERYDAMAGVVHTVDGNHNDRVARASRPHSQVRGGVHIPEKPKPIPAPEPFWVIATSENGHKVLVFTKFATQKTVAGMLPRLLAKYGKAGLTIKRGGVRKAA